MSRRIKRLQNKWLLETSSNNHDLEKIANWVNSLEREMRRSGNDIEFIGELLEAAYVYFSETFTEEEKADCFVYLLGLFHRKMK